MKKYLIDFDTQLNPILHGKIDLFQVGRMFCNTDTVIKQHTHPNLFELTIVLDGTGTITTNNIPVKVKKNDIFLSFPYDIHEIISDQNNPLKYDFLSFNSSESFLAENLKKISLLFMQPEKRIFSSSKIQYLTNVLLAEKINDSILKTEMISSLLEIIVLYTISAFLDNNSSTNKLTPSLHEELCFMIMSYINSNIFTMTNLKELTKITNYSYPYISSVFHKTTSMSLLEYYHFQRLEKAKELIQENNYSLTTIAYKLNYTSIYSFSKAFKKLYGHSPQEYKKLYKQKNT